jgi:hypothetical protein
VKLSQAKRSALYGAIHEGVLGIRCDLARDGLSAQHDARIAQAEHDIWRRVKAALGLEDTRG